MNTAEAIIAIHGHRFDYLALTITGESWASLDLALDSTNFSDTNVLIEGEITVHLSLLIVLADACSVNALMRRAKTDQIVIWILLLYLELRQDERELCKLGLSLIFD